jgi:hypothetical protein
MDTRKNNRAIFEGIVMSMNGSELAVHKKRRRLRLSGQRLIDEIDLSFNFSARGI